MVVSKHYELFYDRDRDLYIVHSSERQRCPICGSVLSGYDRRIRSSVSSDGIKKRFLLRRMKCSACSALHIELLDFMEMQKHYDSSVIQRAKENPADCPADDSTIRLWKK